jgi:OmpA-OmpF porin, OOP family
MTSTLRAFSHGLAAIAALGIATGACAQSSQSSLSREIGNSSSQAGKSFIDLAIGKSTYNTSCGNLAGLSCSRGTTSYSLTAGNMITDNVGIELSALNFGNTDRAGGSVIARGLNLSAVGRVPLGDVFAIEGKIGPTYGVTKVSAPAMAGIESGKARGVGLGYGVALDVNVARGIHGSVGWEQHDFKFAGQGRSAVSNITLALGYTF